LEPRKNLLRLLKAMAILKDAGLRYPLVIAGKRGWMYREVLEHPLTRSLQNEIVFLGYCTDAQLRWLYNHAAALAYVSLYEGFGFPPLEAMTAGLPVVASRVGSIPEVCGNAARYVDPTSSEDIAQGIQEACSDAALRDRLIAAGRARARLFDWRKTALEVSAVYDECS
jgi:glycosyltransferase involved in cell wall biosynthesis